MARTSERMTGVVKWFDDAKGYGFITPDIPGGDIFVHFSGIRGTGRRNLTEGSRVEYTEEMGQKNRLQATGAVAL